MKLNRAQWIKYRAEQLALRADRETFLDMYATRAHYFGFAAYDAANQGFRDFLQPYIDEARKAFNAEAQAHYESGWINEQKSVYAEKDLSVKPIYGVDESAINTCQGCGEEFEADNGTVEICAECEEKYCVHCGAVIENSEDTCEDCANEDEDE